MALRGGPRGRVQVIGVPFNSSGKTDGVAGAPAALRQAGLVAALRAAGPEVDDRGDVELDEPNPERDAASRLIAPGAITSMIGAVKTRVAGGLAEGAFPLVLGGDCPIIIGCLAAAIETRPEVGLLFVDGHEDAWPPEQSPSGEAADSELGFLLGLNRDRLPADLRASIPNLSFDRVAVLGPRDQDEFPQAGVTSIEGRTTAYRSAEAVAADPEAAVAYAVERLARMKAWWLHVDLDVLSTESLAAVDYPQAGGLDWEALRILTAAALRSPGVIGWDITIYNPDLDGDASGAARITRYVGDALTSARDAR